MNAAVRVYGHFLEIGEETWIGSEVVFWTGPRGPIIIGGRCDVGPAVYFVSGSHDIGGEARRAGRGRADRIEVGDGCWIGCRATILGGAVIGRGCVIASGAVVKSGIYAANLLLAGVPAEEKRLL